MDVPARAYVEGQMRKKTALPVRKLPFDSLSWYCSTALGEVPVVIM